MPARPTPRTAPARRRRPRPIAVEPLEARQLLAVDFLRPFSVPLNAGAGNLADGVRDVAVDAAGNTYITGAFSGTVDFDPGPGTTNLTSAGGLDIFVAKYTAAGALVYAHRAGDSGDEDVGHSIAVDAAGNAYVTGRFLGTADFNPGPGTTNLTAAGVDPFVWKLDPAGNLVYARSATGTPLRAAFGEGIDVDEAGNVYITGQFQGGGSLTFATAPATTLTAVNVNGQWDVFVAKLTPAGNFTWAGQFAGSGGAFNRGLDVAADAGGVYLTGQFGGTVDFDPGPGTSTMQTAGPSDINGFVAKLTPAGALSYARQVVGPGLQQGLRLAVDGAGAAHVVGVFAGVSDLDPGPGTVLADRPAGVLGHFLLKLDAAGNTAWARDLATSIDFNNPNTGLVFGFGGLGLDGAGNVYVAGSFSGTAGFGPTLVPSLDGSQDVFLAKYDANGANLDVARIGGAGRDLAYGLAVAPDGTATVAGTYVSVGGQPVSAGGYVGALGGLPAAPNSALYVARARIGQAPRGAQIGDLDGNDVTDLGVFEPGSAAWFVGLQGPDGARIGDRNGIWGAAGNATRRPLSEFPVPGDYDGNGVTDRAVFNVDNAVYKIQYLDAAGNVIGTNQFQFGFPGLLADQLARDDPSGGWERLEDLPIPGDYDGNGVTDLAVFRVDTAEWIIKLLDVGTPGRPDGIDPRPVAQGGNVVGNRVRQFGTPGTLLQEILLDVPIPGDYDGNGVTDFAVYRRPTGEWLAFFKDASGGDIGARAMAPLHARTDDPTIAGQGVRPIEAAFPIPGDYDGNGVTDIALWDAATADWRIALIDATGATINRVDDGASNTRRQAFGAPANVAARVYPHVPLHAPYSSLIKRGVLPGIAPPAATATAAGVRAGWSLASAEVPAPVPLLAHDGDAPRISDLLGRRKDGRRLG